MSKAARACASSPTGGAVGRLRRREARGGRGLWEPGCRGARPGGKGRAEVQPHGGQVSGLQGQAGLALPHCSPMSLMTSRMGSSGRLRRGRHLRTSGFPASWSLSFPSWEMGRWAGRVAPERTRGAPAATQGRSRLFCGLPAGPLTFAPRPVLPRCRSVLSGPALPPPQPLRTFG